MRRALVAQWIERSPAKAEVVGSNPAKRAIFVRNVIRMVFGGLRDCPLALFRPVRDGHQI